MTAPLAGPSACSTTDASAACIDSDRAAAAGTALVYSPYMAMTGRAYHYALGNWLETAQGGAPTGAIDVVGGGVGVAVDCVTAGVEQQRAHEFVVARRLADDLDGLGLNDRQRGWIGRQIVRWLAGTNELKEH